MLSKDAERTKNSGLMLGQPLSGCGASIDLTLFSNRSNSLYGGHHEWPSEYQDFATGPVLPSLTNSTIRNVLVLRCHQLDEYQVLKMEGDNQKKVNIYTYKAKDALVMWH